MKKHTGQMVILPKPMTYSDFLNKSYIFVPDNHFLITDDIIILSSSRLFSAEHSGPPYRDNRFQTWLKVILPFEGYLNSTFFTKDSMWIERIG